MWFWHPQNIPKVFGKQQADWAIANALHPSNVERRCDVFRIKAACLPMHDEDFRHS